MQSQTVFRRLGAALTVATLLSLTALWSAEWAEAAVPADDGIVEHVVQTPPDEVKSSWTPAQLRDAIPVDADPSVAAATAFETPSFPDASVSARAGDFLVKDATTFPNRLQGRVFFRVGTTGYTCSATLISSRYGNAAFTAGHCLYDIEAKEFANAFVFAPGYRNGAALALYPATSLATTKRWIKNGSFSGDIGIVTFAGNPTSDLGGARPVAFNMNPKGRKYTIYGYPSTPNPPYTGESLAGCRARYAGRDQGRPRTVAAYPCYLGHGTSGGGWISHGYLHGVSSYYYCDQRPKTCGYLFAPYFGKLARKLYTRPSIGGSIDPVIAIIKHPKRRTSKRNVRFRFFGLASTPLKYRCKFDKRRYVKCRARTSIRRLRPGRHSLRIKAFDQLGRKAGNSPRFRFFVKR